MATPSHRYFTFAILLRNLSTKHERRPMQSTLSASAAAPPPALSTAQVRRAVVASVIGNGLEWFDFLIYGYFAKIIAQVFFPGDNAFVSIALTLATFAVGFLVRPLGGILLGLYADRVGRRRALSLLIVSMAA